MHNVIMEVYVCAFVFSSHQMRKMHIKCHFLMKAKHANKNSQLCTNVIERALSCVDLRFLFLVLIKVQERHESARSKWLFSPVSGCCCCCLRCLLLQLLCIFNFWYCCQVDVIKQKPGANDTCQCFFLFLQISRRHRMSYYRT